jgi:hypothetical protein
MGKRQGSRGGRHAGGGGKQRPPKQNSRFHGRPVGQQKVAAFSGNKETMFGGGKRGIMSLGTKVSAGEARALSGKKRPRTKGRPGVPQAWEPGSRRQRRKDEREERKRRKLESSASGGTASGGARRRRFTNAALAAAEAGGSRMAHDSEWGNDMRKQQMQMQRLASAVEKERERLESYIDPEVEAEICAREAVADKQLQSLHPVARKLQIENGEVEGYVDPGSGACVVRARLSRCGPAPYAELDHPPPPPPVFWGLVTRSSAERTPRRRRRRRLQVRFARPAGENLFETTPEGGCWAR